MDRPQLRGKGTVVVDATGVGQAVADMFRDAGTTSVFCTITGGNTSSRSGRSYTVPKAHLASTTQALLQSGRLQMSARVPHTNLLKQELKSFRVKVTGAGSARFEHREGEHDDLVLAAALAVWYGEHNHTSWLIS
jgi:hypothetical protein